jgi:hypothetical protein
MLGRLVVQRSVILLAAIVAAVSVARAEPTWWTLEATAEGQRYTGYPLRADEGQVALILRNGRMVEFAPAAVTEFKKVSSSFRAVSAGELRAQLLAELPPGMDVTGTSHYVVAHPSGRGQQWAERFEELHRAMSHYFLVWGFKLQPPRFPLAAVVWENQVDFMRHAQSQGAHISSGVIGYYSLLTNQVSMFDMAAGQHDPEAWRQNAATIVHEAAHQTAFNTGIHTRFAATPTWIIEGLGTMFEPRGVWDSRHYPHLADRINRDRLTYFRQYLKQGRPSLGYLLLINSDELFRVSPMAAYAEAWALSFYLSETQPQKYGQLLKRMAALEPFQEYPPATRMRDFAAIFGTNARLFEADYLRFIAGL